MKPRNHVGQAGPAEMADMSLTQSRKEMTMFQLRKLQHSGRAKMSHRRCERRRWCCRMLRQWKTTQGPAISKYPSNCLALSSTGVNRNKHVITFHSDKHSRRRTRSKQDGRLELRHRDQSCDFFRGYNFTASTQTNGK
jgi:hypothetical protein